MGEFRSTTQVRCDWCGLPITVFDIPKCKRCRRPMCSPYLRDCAYEHFRTEHLGKPRKIRDVQTERV